MHKQLCANLLLMRLALALMRKMEISTGSAEATILRLTCSILTDKRSFRRRQHLALKYINAAEEKRFRDPVKQQHVKIVYHRARRSENATL